MYYNHNDFAVGDVIKYKGNCATEMNDRVCVITRINKEYVTFRRIWNIMPAEHVLARFIVPIKNTKIDFIMRGKNG